MNEQLSLFGDETGIAAHQNENSSGKLIVTQLSFVEGTAMTWKDLFSGFDSLYAITYSSGLGFVTELVSLFESAEIIFGCEQVIPDFGSEIADIEWVTTAKDTLIKAKRIKFSRVSMRV